MPARQKKLSYQFCCNEIFGGKAEIDDHNQLVHDMSLMTNNNDKSNSKQTNKTGKKCLFCKKTFDGSKQFNDHIKTFHEQADGSCEICKSKMRRPESIIPHFKKHIKNALNNARLRANVISENSFDKQMDDDENNEEIDDDQNNEEIDDDQNNASDVSKKRAARKPGKRCVPCGGIMLTNRELNRHIERLHLVDKSTCKECVKVFASPTSHFKKKHLSPL